MSRYRKPALGLAVVVVVAIAAYLGVSWWLYLSGRASSGPAPPPGGPTAGQPGHPREEVVIKRPSLKHTEGGRLAWQVRLKELKVAAGGQAVAAAGMREALIYDKTGAPVIRLAAQQARGNTADRNLEVTGNVRAVSQKGALITTDKVQWLEQERKLYCPGKVTLRIKNAALTTTGLTYFVEADTVKCPNPVRMYNADNKLIGRELVYKVTTGEYWLNNVQAVFNPQTAKQALPVAPR